MSKNLFDFIFMGFNKNKNLKNKQLEQEEKANRAKAFDQAFSDKTYSVAKKVLDNVEKVADYDYDALFERVNKAIDGKIPKATRTLTPEERKARSEEFDKKIESKVKNFDIDDYLESQKNYKDSIIEKTRKNIQKKYEDADKRQQARGPKKVVERPKRIKRQPPKKPVELKTEPVKTEKIEPVQPVQIEPVEVASTIPVEPEVTPIVEEKKSVDPTTVNVNYSKDEINRTNRYFKNRKKAKFAKRMKVELEDSIIGQQKRSLKRLFKFSLSFKLSSVFIILIILTVVSLSVAFYFGIDFVLLLQQQGKIEDIQFFRDVLTVLLIIFDMAAILICISLGTKASRELVSPIDEMTHIVREINANKMDRRLNVKGMHDELKELAMTFNEMLDRIENSYETQNRFTSDASHELRTPIAVIQGYINMLDRWESRWRNSRRIY